MNKRKLRVCYFGTYRGNYARNVIIIDGLRRAGVEVVECHEPLWHSFEDRERVASGSWASPEFVKRVSRAYTRLVLRYLHMPKDFDAMIVGYPGQFDVLLARVLSWLSGKPLVWDILMSIYLICVERGLEQRSPFTVRMIRLAEGLACHLPDLLILDTRAYMSWFCDNYGIDPDRFRQVPLTADERAFDPSLGQAARRDPQIFRVLYYGTFIPNHGVPYVVEAARLLADRPDVRFELVGEGPQKEHARALAERYGLRNVAFTGWLNKPDLVRRIAESDICLGTFGDTPQSLMTVQNKIYEGLAMQRPVITGDSPAVREVLTHGEDIFLVDRSDPRSLAEAIVAFRECPERAERQAARGRRHFVERFSISHTARRFSAHLDELVRRHRSRAERSGR